MTRDRRVWGMRALVGALLLMPTPLVAGDPDDRAPRSFRVQIVAGQLEGSIEIDGDLSEAAWAAAEPVTGFIQREPIEGEIAEQQTEVRVLFGEDAIYVAARMMDSEPRTIADQLVRRDGDGQFDYFLFALDPNRDRRTGYTFQVSAANVQKDFYIYGDEKMDVAWNAVWESAVGKDVLGWTVEMRVPLSQIRYEAGDELQTWGVNFGRRRIRSNEMSFYSPISRLRRGLTSQFGLMEGVRVPASSRRIEARPYVLSSAHTGPSAEGDPFFDGSEVKSRMGLELRYGIGANFTLDATVNPDFGQVEADPAVINLSAFETFLTERRPFFVEDARIFDFSLGGMRDQLFYSRRIGRSPQGRAPFGADYSRVPDDATILGAAKISGRTSGGLSIGVLGAVTDRETGQSYYTGGQRQEDFLVEPRTSYGVVRVQQDFSDGASQIGGIVTGLNRELPEDGSFDFLTSQAFSAGLDFELQWGDREWALFGFFTGSRVQGDSTALIRIQRSANHYFQRPDASRLSMDSTATSMNGASWRLTFERRRGKHWTGSVWAAEITPGFEINDLGFSRSQERLDAGARLTYREIVPGAVFRNYNLTLMTFHNWSHDVLDDFWSASEWSRQRTSGTYWLRAGGQFLNYWNLNVDARYRPDTSARTATRGGPLMLNPSSLSGGFSFNSDRRKTVSVGGNLSITKGSLDSRDILRAGLDVTYRPSPRMQLRIKPGFESNRTGDQYVTSTGVLPYAPTYGRRYIFAELDQKTFSMETRLDVSFTPHLTLQLFAQPLIASGDYVRYGQLAAPETYDLDFFADGTYVEQGGDAVCQGGRICRDGDTQRVDLDGDGAVDYAFSDRDFNQRSLVGNAVLRWEYRPGSTVFLVWQRRQFGRADIGDFDLGRDAAAIFDAPADNRFIVKVNYWLGL
jgi:Domain of unknown function (DUF5916)/Carbohydrate family 9 binding domain-like